LKKHGAPCFFLSGATEGSVGAFSAAGGKCELRTQRKLRPQLSATDYKNSKQRERKS